MPEKNGSHEEDVVGGKKSGRWKQAYNAEVHEQIVKALERGAYQVHAANAAGVSITTMQRWLKMGREGVEPFVVFAHEVDRARANDALRNQAVISAAAVSKVPGDWKAAAWNLERKFPKLYGRRAMVDNVDDLLAPPLESLEDDNDDSAVYSPWLNS